MSESAASKSRPWCECDPDYDGRCPYPCQIDADEKREAASAASVEYLPPLSSVEEILWCAALDLVPIEDRIAWVEKMTARIEALNERRVRTETVKDNAPTGGLDSWDERAEAARAEGRPDHPAATTTEGAA